MATGTPRPASDSTGKSAKAGQSRKTGTPAPAAGGKAVAGKDPAKKTAAAKTAPKKSASAKKTGKPVASHTAADMKKTATGKGAPSESAAARTSPSTKSSNDSGRITPAEALANTRALLKAKKQHDRQPQPWQKLDQHGGPADHTAQSPEADDNAEQLHEGESRMQAIQGSIGSTDRKNQGKRDAR